MRTQKNITNEFVDLIKTAFTTKKTVLTMILSVGVGVVLFVLSVQIYYKW